MKDLDLKFRQKDIHGKGLSNENFTTEYKQDVETIPYKLDNGYSLSELRTLSNDKINTTNLFYCSENGKEGFWKYDSTDTSSADNLGTILVTGGGKRLKRIIEDYVYPEWFGAKGDGVTDDTIAFREAINYLDKIEAKKLNLYAKTYKITDTVYVNEGITILGQGVDQTKIFSYTSGTCFLADKSMDEFSWEKIYITNFFDEFSLIAKNDAATSQNAIGIDFGNSYGGTFGTIKIEDFKNGRGIRIKNSTIWTEGTVFKNVHTRNCKIHVEFTVLDVSQTSSYISFCNTRIQHLNCVTRDNQIAVQLSNKADMYASTLIIKGNFEDTGANQIGLNLINSNIKNSQLDIVFEGGKLNATDESCVVKLISNSEIYAYGTVVNYTSAFPCIIDNTSRYKLGELNSNTFVGQFSTVKRTKIYTLKSLSDGSNLEKLFIDVYGGTWFSSNTGITKYIITSRGELQILEETLQGVKSSHQIKIYQTIDNEFDVVLETPADYISINVEVRLLQTRRMSNLKLTSEKSISSYDITGLTDVTPASVSRIQKKSIASIIASQDGVLQLIDSSTSQNLGVIDGEYRLSYIANNRNHIIRFTVTTQQYSVAKINILSNYAFSLNNVFSNLRVIGNTSGSKRLLVVDVANRNSDLNNIILEGIGISSTPSLLFNPVDSTTVENLIANPMQKSGQLTLINGVGTMPVNGVNSNSVPQITLRVPITATNTWNYKASISSGNVVVTAISATDKTSTNTSDNSIFFVQVT